MAGTKTSFRTQTPLKIREKRGLIPANGYYEWQEGGERKQPYHIQMPGWALFAFGGL